MEIRVNVKQIGKKRNGVREVRYESPGCPGTVEELIRGKESTFSAFVVAAVRAAVEEVQNQQDSDR